MTSYKCKNHKSKITIAECEKCYMKGKTKDYPSRAVCQLYNLEWLKQLKEIEKKAGIFTEEDINFLKYCIRRKIISYIEGDKYSFNKDFIEFRKEIAGTYVN